MAIGRKELTPCPLLKRDYIIKRATPGGNSARVYVPRKYLGRRLLIIILDEEDEV